MKQSTPDYSSRNGYDHFQTLLALLYESVFFEGTLVGLVERPIFPGVDTQLFLTIVLFNNQPFPSVSEGSLERRIPGKNGESTPRILIFFPCGFLSFAPSTNVRRSLKVGD